jgi:hypothetical protein
MKTEYVYEYGQRWNRKTPRWAIGHHVDAYHVSMHDADVTADLNTYLDKAGPEFTPVIKRECIRYALLRHQRNFKLYVQVMRGG